MEDIVIIHRCFCYLQKEFTDAKEKMKKTKELARRLLDTAKKVTNTKSNEELSEELKNVSVDMLESS